MKKNFFVDETAICDGPVYGRGDSSVPSSDGRQVQRSIIYSAKSQRRAGLRNRFRTSKHARIQSVSDELWCTFFNELFDENFRKKQHRTRGGRPIFEIWIPTAVAGSSRFIRNVKCSTRIPSRSGRISIVPKSNFEKILIISTLSGRSPPPGIPEKFYNSRGTISHNFTIENVRSSVESIVVVQTIFTHELDEKVL